ncbi:MAG: tRNA 2-thiouridine(34) synthase MnmA [Polyangiales bacterium]
MKRVVVGMSGGVDSSVAAVLLQRDGWEVIGVTLHLWDYVREGHEGRCCAPEDQYDAARVCARLDIAHYTFDRRALFREAVVDHFVADYAAGRTPSPCVRCNESVKLGPLAEIADALGASHIASGHYARLSQSPELQLSTALDPAKDQSYFLWAAPTEALARTLLPLGGLTKPEVRAIAADIGLCNAEKPDSTDLCFLEGRSYADFIAQRVVTTPGPIEDADGRVVGQHDGVHAFTVGQRRGVGAGGAPRYVLRIVPDRSAVIVGDDAQSRARGARLEGFRWLTATPPARVRARLRYRHPGVEADIDATGDTAVLRFEAPQRGVAPGQAAVLYDGARVVGGGWIAEGLS